MKKVGLKLDIQKTKIVASGPIISWQIEGGKVAVTNFIFLSSKITAGDNCSYEIKMLAPWNKSFHKPWVETIPWKRKWKPTLVFLPGIPGTEEPGRLQSVGGKRVKQYLATKQQQQCICIHSHTCIHM